MMDSRSRRGPNTLQPVRGIPISLLGRRQHGMIGRTTSCFENEKPGQLRRHLLQVLEVNLRRKYVGCCLVVNHLITKGFGAFPAVSIQTLLV